MRASRAREGVGWLEYGVKGKGRGVASPRPLLVRRSRRSLAPTRGRSPRGVARLARSANPSRDKGCQRAHAGPIPSLNQNGTY